MTDPDTALDATLDTAPDTAQEPARPRVTARRRAALVWQGTRSAWRELGRWRRAERFQELADAADAAGNHREAVIAASQRERVQRDRGQSIGNHVRVVCAGLSGGYWVYALFTLVALAYQWRVWKASKTDQSLERERSGVKAAWLALAITWSMWLANWLLSGARIPLPHPHLSKATGLTWTWDIHLGWSWANTAWMAGVLALMVGLFLRATWNGTVSDELSKVSADPEPAVDGDGAVVAAFKASSARMPKDTQLSVVAPGVMPLRDGALFRVTLDTGGPSTAPYIAAWDDIASRLNLSAPRLILERDDKYGRQITATGIKGDPWGPPTRSPLVDAVRFSFGRDPIPYCRDITGTEHDLPLFEMHYLVGGMPRKGKSSSCCPFWLAAALDPWAPIWVIDGGEVDTAVLRDSGVAARYTTDQEEALDVLQAVSDEIERRQGLLAAEGLKRPDEDFYARNRMSDGLLLFDEFASFTKGPDSGLSTKITKLLVSILQRAPKTGIHVVLSTQSPSARAFDTDGRCVVPGRIALKCDSADMSDKIMGRYAAAHRGIDASKLPDDVKGVQWMSTPDGGTRVVRPHFFTDADVNTLIGRARVLRGTPDTSDTSLLQAIADVMHARGLDYISAEELLLVGGPFAGHNPVTLAAALRPSNVAPARPPGEGGRRRYLLADVETALRRSRIHAV